MDLQRKMGLYATLVATVAPFGVIFGAIFYFEDEPYLGVPGIGIGRAVGILVGSVATVVGLSGCLLLGACLRKARKDLGKRAAYGWSFLAGAVPVIGAVITASIWGYGQVQHARLTELSAHGILEIAHDAEVTVQQAARHRWYSVRAVIDENGESRAVDLDFTVDRRTVGDTDRRWVPAPEPYVGTFTVLQSRKSDNLVVAEADLPIAIWRMENRFISVGAVGTVFCVVWGLPWLVHGVRALRRDGP